MNLINIVIIIIIILILLGLLYYIIKYYKQNGGIYTQEDIEYLFNNYEKIQKDYFNFVMENDLTNVFDSHMLWVFYLKQQRELDEFYYNYSIFQYKFGWKIHLGIKPKYQIDIIRIVYKYYNETTNIYEFKHISYFPALISSEVDKFLSWYDEYAKIHAVSEKMKNNIEFLRSTKCQKFKLMAKKYNKPLSKETFGRSYKIRNKYNINDIINISDLHQDSKFIAIYPMNDVNAKCIINDLMKLFNIYLNKNNLEWDDVFMGIGTDFEIKKGIGVRFCEFADQCKGTTILERYTPVISNIILNKFIDNCIIINNLCDVPKIINNKIQMVANNNFIKIATIPSWEDFFQKKFGKIKSIEFNSNNQIDIKNINGIKVSCNRLKKYELTRNNQIIEEYINKQVTIYENNEKITNKIETGKNYTTSIINTMPFIPMGNNIPFIPMGNNIPFIPIYNNDDIDISRDIDELIKNKDYIFSESNCYDCIDNGDEYIIDTSVKVKSLTQNKKVDEITNNFIKNLDKKKYNITEINSILNVLAIYPEMMLHIYSYFNKDRISIFKNISRFVLYKILYHLIHSDNIIETKINDNYQHPFNNLYYRLNDNYNAILLPKKIKYINPVINIYNILFAKGRIPDSPIYRGIVE